MNERDYEYHKTTLENGVRVVTETMPHSSSLSMGVIIDAGPRDEPLDRCGLAHLSEHLMFQGTSSRDAMQIARMMDGAGGYIGGFTSRDYTAYTATVLAEFGTYALDLLGDILLNSVFPAESVAREKDAIVCEIEASLDAPDQRVQQLLRQRAWSDHSLGRPVAGRTDVVRSLTREDVIYFVHENYLPDRTIIAAAGNVAHEDFVAQVRDAFWRLLGERKAAPADAPVFRAGVTLEHAPVSQAYFSVGVEAPAYADRDRYAVHVFSKVLGDGISSRLFRRIREERGLVYDIGCEYQAYRDSGLFIIEGSTTPENLTPVIDLTLDELHRLSAWEEPADDEELLRAKTQIRGQHLISGEDVNTRMSRLATQELYFGRRVPSVEALDRIAEVDGPALRRLGSEVLGFPRGRVAVAVTGPETRQHYDLDRLEALVSRAR